MREVDAIDNGVSIYPDVEGQPLYHINTNLSKRVGRLNPSWQLEGEERKENERFRQAVALTFEEFVESAKFIAESWLPARTIVEEAVADAKTVSVSTSTINEVFDCIIDASPVRFIHQARSCV